MRNHVVSIYRCQILMFSYCRQFCELQFLQLMDDTTFAKLNFSKSFFNLYINLLLIWFISNWASCRTIQGEIMLLISNGSCTARSFSFEITPWIAFYSVQLLILIPTVKSEQQPKTEKLINDFQTMFYFLLNLDHKHAFLYQNIFKILQKNSSHYIVSYINTFNIYC